MLNELKGMCVLFLLFCLLIADALNRKFVAADGSRYFWEARFCTVTFDASPQTLTYIDRLVKSEDSVIRSFTLKQISAVERVHATNFKNPYIGSTRKPQESLDWDKIFQ